MGLTIHQDFKFKGTKEEALGKLKKVQSVAKDLPFEEVGEIVELDYSKGFNDEAENKRCGGEDPQVYRWTKIQYSPKGKWVCEEHTPEKNPEKFRGFAVMVWAGEGCEPTNIGLISKDGKNWAESSFTKTQYAVDFVKCHLLVCTILEVCQKIGILNDVRDEGEYWETKDLAVLGGNINTSSTMIKLLSDTFKKNFGGEIQSAIDKSENYMSVKKDTEKDGG